MAAHNENFPWMSHKGDYDFFKKSMVQHKQVDGIDSLGEGLFNINWKKGNDLKVFICDCYCYTISEYIETTTHYNDVNVVIINSKWCNYTMEAKKHCYDNQVGLYTLEEFMVALNYNNYWEYLRPEQKEIFNKNGWF